MLPRVVRGFPRPCPLPDLPNAILDGTGRDIEYDEHSGPLSIKCVFRGSEVYEVQGARFVVEPGTYLLLNNGQRYASSIHSHSDVESFAVFFRPGFVEEVLTSLITPQDRLLEDPGRTPSQPVAFIERLFSHDAAVMPIVAEMRCALRHGPVDRAWLEEQFHRLLEALLLAHRALYDEISRVPAVRQTTRTEIYRRLYRARDFIDSNQGEPLCLQRVASVAFLSPHHFLRLFKKVFGTTPHQYTTRRRIERARQLLASTDRSVSEICFDVGFESLGSFSTLFRRRVGVAPSTYRRCSRRKSGGR